MTIESVGDNMVKINDRLIPATNLQIEGFPGWVTHIFANKIVQHWYPIYFVILFEDGALWEVTQGEHLDFPERIEISVWYKYSNDKDCSPPDMILGSFEDGWDSFLFWYDAHLKDMEASESCLGS